MRWTDQILLAASLLLVCLPLSCSDEPAKGPSDAADDTDLTTDTGPASYDGAWTSGLSGTADPGAFLSVWGTGPDDVIAVGGQPELGVAYGYDGVSWSPLTVPDGEMLHWVYGVDDEVWIVGARGRALRRVGDGAFEPTSTGTDAPLWGVWGASGDDIWAVGGDARDEAGVPVLIHWLGSAWEPVELPELDRSSPALFKVWGTSADRVLAVGARGVILTWDGQSWAQEPSGSGEDLISLWGTGPDEIAVVGGRSNGILARYDGSQWRVETLLGLPGLNGVWMDRDGTAHVVGVRGVAARVPRGGFEYEREQTGTLLVLHGVWGLHGGMRVAVGGSLNSNPPYEGVILVDP